MSKHAEEVMEKVMVGEKVLVTPYDELDPPDQQMAQLMVAMIKDESIFRKYIAIRKVELDLNKTMNDWTMKDMNITTHDLTRFLQKHAPAVLKEIDKAVKKAFPPKS